MIEQNNEKSPVNLGGILIRVAAWLFVLTMISVYLLGGLFARYISKDNGADSARVAKFDVKVTGPVNNVTCNVTALEPGKINLQVENDSEVAVAYSFRVAIDEKHGCGVRVILDDDDTKKLDFEAYLNQEKTYNAVGNLGVNAAPASHTLTFTAIDWKKITSDSIGRVAKTITQPFTVYVDVVQID